MTRMIGKVIALTLVLASLCLPQSKYNNQLQPGINTRADAARVLGQPIRTLSATQFEYSPPPGVKKVVVEYRNGSSVIERIEVYFIEPVSRKAVLQKLKLPQQADATRTNSEGKLVEYFTAPVLVLTYATAEGTSGVMSLGYYSRELFDRALGKKQRSSETQNNPASTPGFGPEEDNTTFQGATTLRYFGTNYLGHCADACAANPQCKAYTFVKPGAYKSNPNNGVCYLSSSFKKKVSDPCCTSVVKGEPRPGAVATSINSASGRWTGTWTNSRKEAGNSTLNLNEQGDGTITGDESGWTIENGHRSGSMLTWEYHNKNNGCRDYQVEFEISADGSTANGTYKAYDHCENQAYTGTYRNYRR